MKQLIQMMLKTLSYKKILLIPFLVGLVGCSSQEEKLIVICELDNFFDSSLTFDFKNNVVGIKQTLNKYGHETQKKLQTLTKIESLGEGSYEGSAQEMLDIFDETELIQHIRSVDGGFIVFGISKERNDLVDFESTFNRATLKIKKVRRMNESVIPENSGLETLEVSYGECRKPAI